MDEDQVSEDDALEEERASQDPNWDTLRHQSRLPQDIKTPAEPNNDPFTPNLPSDHPVKDSDLDPTDVYESDEDDASDFWDQNESNERENDALYGDDSDH